MRAAAALFASALLASLPAARADGPHVEMSVALRGSLAPFDEPLPFQVAFNFTCGTPADPSTHIDLQAPSGNYFNVTFDRWHWVYTDHDCALAKGHLQGKAQGEFRFTRAMPPFRAMQFTLAVWLGNGEAVWTESHASMNVTPDAHLQIGAILAPPATATIAQGSLEESAQWTVQNHGTGAFLVQVRVEAKPSWLDVSLPEEVQSGPDHGEGANATFTLVARMPADCPAPTALVTLALDARSPVAGSRAHDASKVQGLLPCRPALAKGSAAPALPLVALAVAFLARRSKEQKC